MKIGVDVGGTNTDAVVIGSSGIAGWKKTPTTEDVASGVIGAIGTALDAAGTAPSDVECVMIGTTQFTNAVISRGELLPVGILRLCLPATTAVPPLTDWPADLRVKTEGAVHLVAGGNEFDGREISPLDERAVMKAARDFRNRGLRTVAVTGVASPMNNRMELRAAEILRNELPDIEVSLSSEIGRFGMLQRENSTIINAALSALAKRVVSAFERAIADLDLDAPLFISQNDGTLMRAEDVVRYPVLTFASGPTNSMRGAAYLAGVQDAMVVDIGGTTSDIGMLRSGFPRQSTHFVDVGGVKTNFRMPDVLAVGLGGGSYVRDEGRTLGPDSVGFRLTRDALVFGGDVLTASDIAVAGGWADFGDRSLAAHVPPAVIANARARMQAILDESIDRMKTEAGPIPVVVVGGGSVLVDWDFSSASDVLRPAYASVANAVGAAIAQVSGEVEKVVTMSPSTREQVISEAKAEACANAISAGATSDSVEIIEIEEVPISYLPDNPTRLRIKAVGDLPLALATTR